MRALTAALLAASLLASPVFAQTPPQAAEGVWVMDDDSARIKIAPCASQPARLCGTIVSIKPRPPSEKAKARAQAQPKAKTKDGRPPPTAESMIGTTIMVGFKPNGPGKWNGGRFEFPGSDMKVNATLAINKDGTLRVQGCVLVMCGGQNWKRAA